MSDVKEGVDALLMDVRIVHVRPVSEADAEALNGLYTRTSPHEVAICASSLQASGPLKADWVLGPGCLAR